MNGQGGQGDLLVIALPGVQQFIAEARSTSDVAAASRIYSVLAELVTGVLRDEAGGTLVLPGRPDAAPLPGSKTAPGLDDDAEAGVPNRIVALFPAGTGAGAARQARHELHKTWEAWVRRALSLGDGDLVPETPGFPRLQWVCVPAQPGGYEEQWHEARRLLVARRRIRDFVAVPEEQWRRRALCSLAPRWPAEPGPPPGVPGYEKNTPLSAVGWVKRRWRHNTRDEGFPSTASITSAPYRQAVLQRLDHSGVGAAVRDLMDAVDRVAGVAPDLRGHPETPVPGLGPLIGEPGPGRWLGRSGGPWVYPDRWQAESLARQAGLLRAARDPQSVREVLERIGPLAESGRAAARGLLRVMGEQPGLPPLASYLAVVVQDLDSMGLFLSGKAPDGEGRKIKVSPNEHGRVSLELLRAAAGQRAALRDGTLLGVPAYAGGDDLLAFVPASKALAAAQACHDAIPASLPRASTAVLFFHYHASIQQAMSEARTLLDRGKDRVRGKHALAVGYLRRSGVTGVSIQPWDAYDAKSSAHLFGLFARGHQARLSPRLVADLERDAGELSSLVSVPGGHYRKELARLVRRHLGGETAAGRAASRPESEALTIAAALEWLGEHEHSPSDAGSGPGPLAAARVGVFLRQEAR